MEIMDDVIIIPAETAAHMWMDRFIKQYKYGTDNGVIVDGKKITWTGDFKVHSIDLKNDIFIIDGDEVFINAKLWNKYLKMREITGSWYVRAPKKIAFPNDWSDLSEEQVLENIQYLQKNYKKYEISQPDDNSIKIDNVVISRNTEGNVANGRTYYTINNKKYYRNKGTAKELAELMHICKMYKLPFKQKANNWWKNNKDDVKYWGFGGGAVMALFVLTYFMATYSDKSAKQSKQQLKQEIINEVIDSLHKEQQKTINYNDSIKTR